MAAVEQLALLITANPNQAVRAIGQVTGATGRLADTQPRLSRVGQTLTRTLTPAAIGLAGASALMFNEFDQGADALRAAGAVGDEFTESMKRVGNNVPASLGQVGQVMGEIFQRTKLTGEPLERLTQQVIELQELGQSVNVEQLTASLAKAGVEAEDMAGALDTMFRVSQTTGTGVDKLSQLQEQFGVALEATGLSMEEQLLLLGQMESQGVNTTSVMSGLGRAYRTLAADTEDPTAALQELLTRMSEAETQAEATAIAGQLFGRSSIEIAAAAQSGALDIESLSAAFGENTDSIHEAAEGTRDWQERLSMLQNKVVGVLGPFGQFGMAIGGIAAAAGPVASGLGKIQGSLSSVTTSALSANVKMHDLVATIGQVPGVGAIAAVGVGALVAVFMDAQREAAEFERSVADASKAIIDGADPVEFFTGKLNDMVLSNDDVRGRLAELGLTTEDVARAMVEGGGAWDDMVGRIEAAGPGVITRNSMALRDLGDQAAETNTVIDESTEILDEQADALNKAKTAGDEAAESQSRFASRVSDVKGELELEIRTLQELHDIVNGSIDAGFAYQQSILDTERAIAGLHTTQMDGEASANDLRQAELDAAESLVDQSRAAADAAEQQAELAGQHLSASDKAAIQRGELERLQEKYPDLRDEIQMFVDQLNAIPAVTKAKIEIDTAEALAALLNFQTIANGIIGGLGNFFNPRVTPTGPPPGGVGGRAVFNTSFAGKPSEREARRVERGQRRLARSVFGAVT
jgi:hypothetical protein